MNLANGSKPQRLDYQKRTMTISFGDHRFLADELQSLLIRRGYRCNMATQRQRTPWTGGEPKNQYLLHIRRQTHATIGGAATRTNALIPRRSKLQPVSYDPHEQVWCLTTPYGTLVTRRNGKVCILGNCGRGFRLHSGKTDCLVLDFGGNVLRHGPVDQLRVDGVGSNGTGSAPAKECPQCHEIIAAGYAQCPACGHVFPPPERRKHDGTATSEGILSDQASRTEYAVEETFYAVHVKRDAPPDAPRTMRVDYRIGFNHYVSEWVCFEHDGYARQKAVAWWRQHSYEPVPDTAEQAVELADIGALAKTLAITVMHKPGDQYDRIVGYRLGDKPARLESPDDLPEYVPPLDESEVPF